MSLLLFYDTETTGLPLFDKPSELPEQPHIVQLSASLVDIGTRKTVQQIDFTIKPDGWVIGEDSVAIHGTTNEQAEKVGISEIFATQAFLRLWAMASMRVGHEENFDARIIRIALKRYDWDDTTVDVYKSSPAYCTLKNSQTIMGGKKPTLQESHKFFIGTEFENAHSARADVDATMRVYWAIQDYKPRGRGKRA